VTLFQNSLFSLPINRHDGTRISQEEAVDLLENDTVSYDSGLGFDNVFSQLLRISIKVEVSKYEDAIAWIGDILRGSEFDPAR
jgi:hypothetical protein